MWKLKFNLKAYLSTAALPGQTTKTALTEEFMFQNVAYWPTVYITGGKELGNCINHKFRFQDKNDVKYSLSSKRKIPTLIRKYRYTQ